MRLVEIEDKAKYLNGWRICWLIHQDDKTNKATDSSICEEEADI